MDTIVFLTVLFSAILHAIWNSMASKYKNKNCRTEVMLLPAPRCIAIAPSSAPCGKPINTINNKAIILE